MRLTVLGNSPVEINRLAPFFHLIGSLISPETPASAAPVSTKAAPSFIKQVGNAQFLLAPLHLQTPQLGVINLGAVDAILISNYLSSSLALSLRSFPSDMLALPFITEHSEFKGRVLATQPTIETGRQLMEELVLASHAQTIEGGNLLSTALPTYFHELLPDAHLLRQCYGMKDVESCLNKIESLSYGEQVVVNSLRVCPLSSGFSLGAAYWQLMTEFKKIVYLPDASSLATRHPEPLDVKGLANADVMLMSHLSSADLTSPPETSIERAMQLITSVLKEGGNVLVPSYPSGIVFDLIEALGALLPPSGLGSIPMYFVSPAAETALAYSNICAEWLCKPKQDKAYIPEPPFVHADLQNKGSLSHFPDIATMYAHGFREPCIVFAGHPSLRMGSAAAFVRAWSSEAKHAVVFVEPEFSPVLALAPFQPLALRVFSAPIDLRLSFSEANGLLREVKPKLLLIPASYAAVASSDATARSAIISECPHLTFASLDTLTVPMQNRFERGVLSAKLAQELEPSPVSEGAAIRFAEVSAVLSVRDSEYLLEAHPSVFSLGAQKRRRLFGLPRLPALLSALEEKNVRPVKVTRDMNGTTLELPSLSATIHCTARETHVETESDSARHLLRTIILSVMK